MSDNALNVCSSCTRREVGADTCLPSVNGAELRNNERVYSNTVFQDCMYYVEQNIARTYYNNKCNGREFETRMLGLVIDKMGTEHYRLVVDKISDNLFAYTREHSGVLKVAFIIPKDRDYVQVQVPEHIYNTNLLSGNKNKPEQLKDLKPLSIEQINLEPIFENYIEYKREGFPFFEGITIASFLTPDGILMENCNGGYRLDLVEGTEGWAYVYAMYDSFKPNKTRFFCFDNEIKMFRQINRKQKRKEVEA